MAGPVLHPLSLFGIDDSVLFPRTAAPTSPFGIEEGPIDPAVLLTAVAIAQRPAITEDLPAAAAVAPE